MTKKAEIGSKLKKLRLARGLTQSELAEVCSINQTQVTRYEKGLNKPTARILYKLAIGLDVTAEYFTDFEDTPLSEIDAEYARLRTTLFDSEDKLVLKKTLRNFYVANQNKNFAKEE